MNWTVIIITAGRLSEQEITKKVNIDTWSKNIKTFKYATLFSCRISIFYKDVWRKAVLKKEFLILKKNKKLLSRQNLQLQVSDNKLITKQRGIHVLLLNLTPWNWFDLYNFFYF